MRHLALLALIAGVAPAVARTPHRSSRRLSGHHGRLLGRAPAAGITEGEGVAAQLVPSNPAVSSVFLLAGAPPSVRIPPSWSFSLGFSRSTFAPTSPSAPVFYSATLPPSADPLPAWLTFDESGLFLSGVAPAEDGAWAVQMCAGTVPGAREACETFYVVVDATPWPGEVRAGDPTPPLSSSPAASSSVGSALVPTSMPPSASTVPPSSSASPSPTSSPPSSPAVPSPLAPAADLQRLNVTAGALDLAWSPASPDGESLFGGLHQRIAVDCSAVDGLAWVAANHSFVGNVSASAITDDAYPSTSSVLSASALSLPVVLTFSNGSTLALQLPLSVYPALLSGSHSLTSPSTAVRGAAFSVDVASDALLPTAGSRPSISVSFDPREAASWLFYDARTGRLSTVPTSITRRGAASNASNAVPLDLGYSAVVVVVEARDPVTNAVSRRRRTIGVVPSEERTAYGGLSSRDKMILWATFGSVVGLVLFGLLIWLSRRPARREQWLASIKTLGRGRRAAPIAAGPGLKEMVRHSSLKEIGELKYDSDRMAFDTTGQSSGPASPSSPSASSSRVDTNGTPRLSPSSSHTTAADATSSRRIITPPNDHALAAAVGRFVSLTRRVISGSSAGTKVASSTLSKSASSSATTTTAAEPRINAGYSQATISTYMFVHDVRRSASTAASRSASAPSTVHSSPSSSSLHGPAPPVPARVSRSRSVFPSIAVHAAAASSSGRTVESSFVSGEPASFVSGGRASWESPSTYEWSATSPKSAYSRPSVDGGGREDASLSPSSVASRRAGAMTARKRKPTSTSLRTEEDGGGPPSSSADSSPAVIARASRVSSSCAMHVRVSGASSSIAGFQHALVMPDVLAAPAPALVADHTAAHPQRSGESSAWVYDDGSLEQLARTTTFGGAGGGHNRSFTADTSGDDDGRNSSSSGGSFEAFYPIDHLSSAPPSPPLAALADSSFSSSERTTRQTPCPSTRGRRRRQPSGGSWTSLSPPSPPPFAHRAPSPPTSVQYEARLFEPFFIHPVLDLSVAPARPGLVRALRVTDDGYERLPPWIAFKGGVFEGVPMDADDGLWEFLVKDVSLNRTLCHFTLVVHPPSPSSSFFLSPSPSASTSASASHASSLSASSASALADAPSPPKDPLPATPPPTTAAVRPPQRPVQRRSSRPSSTTRRPDVVLGV